MYIEEAKRLRAIIEQATALLGDKEASQAPALYPKLKQKTVEDTEQVLISAGTRINWNGVVKKASVDLWDTVENNPDNAPSLWADLDYKDGYRIIPSVITVTTSFSKDELGWWNNELYCSLVDNNTYTPEQYSFNWEKVK